MSDAEDAPPRPREGGWGDESGTSAPAPRPGRRRRNRREEKEATPPPASSAEVGGAAEEDDEQDLPKKPSSGWGDEDNGKTNDFKPAGRRNRGGGAESKEASTASTGRCEGPAVDGVFTMKPWGVVGVVGACGGMLCVVYRALVRYVGVLFRYCHTCPTAQRAMGCRSHWKLAGTDPFQLQTQRLTRTPYYSSCVPIRPLHNGVYTLCICHPSSRGSYCALCHRPCHMLLPFIVGVSVPVAVAA